MIFLGAGASKPFGIPTLQEFSEDVFNKLKKLGHEEILNHIISTQEEFNITVDFESLYSILEGLIDPVQSVRKAGPLTAFFIRKKMNLPMKYDYREVLEDLRTIIYNKCTLKSDKVRHIITAYDPLFQASSKIVSSEGHNLKGPQGKLLGHIIATTNYDMSLELYFNSKGISYNDGYSPTQNQYIKSFNQNVIRDPYQKLHFIIKLHGSIWQFIQKSQMIKTIVDPKNAPIPIEIEKEMMIYPTKEKEILNYQYYPFFNLFKNITWTKLLVIGYSFRDEPINMAIIENMKMNTTARITVINPNPDNVLKNLNGQIPDDRIRKIPGYFGSKEITNQLRSLKS